jgi:hypothetical protein
MVAPAAASAQRVPNADVWFETGNEFDRGEPGRVMYSGDAGSYMTVLRVNTDGRVSVLSPSQPNSRSKFSGGGSAIGVPFQADQTEGVGYVFAVASRTPFDFKNYRGQGNSWNFGTLGERGGVDPFEIVDRFARSSVGRAGDYSIAYAPYEIGRGGAGRASYQHGVRYDDGYGYAGGYDDPWGASPYRRGYDNYRYSRNYNQGARNRYSQDPRTRALRHCPDGTLTPYTTPCRAFAQPRQQRTTRPRTRQPLARPTPSPRSTHRHP